MGQPKLTKLSMWGKAKAFDEGRAYIHPHTRKQYPSVTTILKLVDKSSLSQWAADQAILWAIENGDLLNARSPEAAFTAGRYRWNDVRDERAQVGTGVHETIEALHTESWTFPVLDDEQVQIMAQWDLLCEEHVIEPILSEFTVFNGAAGYMGTADGYWLIDGVKCLVDVKTSKNTWPEHFYQLAALWAAKTWMIETSDMVWEAQPAREVEKVAIIHLRADKREIIWVDALELNSGIFDAYASVWYAKEALKAQEKQNKM